VERKWARSTVSGERTPTLTVPSTAPPRSGSWSSLVGLAEGRPQRRYVCQCMCTVCTYASGFIHGSKVWKLFFTGDPCGKKTAAQVYAKVHICQFLHPQLLQGLKLVLTGGPCGGKTTAQVCVSVHVCARMPGVLSTAPRSRSCFSLLIFVKGDHSAGMCVSAIVFTPVVLSMAPRSGSCFSLAGDPCGRKTTAQVCCFSTCVCTYCKWFYPSCQGLEDIPHWWALWREDHSSGMLFQCMCVHILQVVYPLSKVWKIVLTGGPCSGKTTAQVCVSVHVYAHMPVVLPPAPRSGRWSSLVGLMAGRPQLRYVVFVHVYAHMPVVLSTAPRSRSCFSLAILVNVKCTYASYSIRGSS
jgi:hypothetical protein